jgi:hypothetical protein
MQQMSATAQTGMAQETQFSCYWLPPPKHDTGHAQPSIDSG